MTRSENYYFSQVGISATLWAMIEGQNLVVAIMSTKLEKSQQNLQPCDGETIACYGFD